MQEKKNFGCEQLFGPIATIEINKAKFEKVRWNHENVQFENNYSYSRLYFK